MTIDREKMELERLTALVDTLQDLTSQLYDALYGLIIVQSMYGTSAWQHELEEAQNVLRRVELLEKWSLA